MSPVPAGEAVMQRVEELERELRTLRTFLTPSAAAADVHDTGAESGSAAPEDLLLCHVAERDVAVSLGKVSEVLPLARLMKLPDSEASVLGALNLRGAPLVVHDLAQRLTGVRSALTRTDLILVCNIDGRRLGLKITDAMDVVHAVVTPMAEHAADGADDSLLRGAIVHGDDQVVVLDVAAFSGRRGAGCGNS